ncbi:ABC transporter substrate-binding protein [Paenibacillus qinlingensis]|uniref:ABC transporter substrate-binding protein n=1 Tax=Paenibacillus qinlingensis TaxID=1837343 RepID=UPI0015662856|nr:ABC transporter substrate-binding protein [Paenibacillus qinlingensis]NQX63312.1 ABC transporter substrate-binding protein [Paenibacillus qinlingensis]
MKRIQKASLLAVSVSMVLAIFLTGCSSNSKETASSAAPSSSSPTAEPQLSPYTIKLIYPGEVQKDQALVVAEMNKYLTKKINATIDITPISSGSWGDKVNLMIASSEPMDILFAANWNSYATNVTKGAFIDLEEKNLLDKYGKGIKETLGQSALDGARIKGKIYAVPTNKEMATSGGFLLRKDLVEKYKMDLSTLKSERDLEPFLKIIKENEPNMIPLYLDGGNNLVQHLNTWDYMGGATSFGAIDGTLTSTKVVLTQEQQKDKELIDLTHDWFLKGYINKDAPTTKNAPETQVKAGNVFAIVTPLKPGKDAEVSLASSYPFVQAETMKTWTSSSTASGSMLAISKTSKDPERAMMFINLLHTDKYLLNLLDFGIEGVHYVKVNDNVIDIAPGNDPKSNKYLPGAAWMFGSQFLNYLWKNEDPEKWNKFREFNKKAAVSVAVGFTFDTAAVKNEIAATTSVKVEFSGALNTGAVDPNSILPKYLEKLKAAGVDKILTEKQKQFDEFLATKKK